MARPLIKGIVVRPDGVRGRKTRAGETTRTHPPARAPRDSQTSFPPPPGCTDIPSTVQPFFLALTSPSARRIATMMMDRAARAARRETARDRAAGANRGSTLLTGLERTAGARRIYAQSTPNAGTAGGPCPLLQGVRARPARAERSRCPRCGRASAALVYRRARRGTAGGSCWDSSGPASPWRWSGSSSGGWSRAATRRRDAPFPALTRPAINGTPVLSAGPEPVLPVGARRRRFKRATSRPVRRARSSETHHLLEQPFPVVAP